MHGQKVLWSSFFYALRKSHGERYTVGQAWYYSRVAQWIAAGRFYGMENPALKRLGLR